MSLVSKSSLLYEIKELPLCKYTLYGFHRLKVVLRKTVKGMAEDYKILNSPLPVCFFIQLQKKKEFKTIYQGQFIKISPSKQFPSKRV